MTHLSLTTGQLSVLMAGAERVPPAWRRRYLDDVADRLLGRLMTSGSIDDETVNHAVAATMQRIGLPGE
jgi:hypothetical protein